MNRSRLINVMCVAWLAGYTTLVSAAGNTFAQDVLGYDYMSLAFAAAAGLFGGAARTIFTLASDKLVVLSIWREFLKDAVVAVVGGAVAYVVVQGLNGLDWVHVPRDLRMLIVVGAGWSRGKWFGTLNRATENLVDNVMQKARGGAPEGPSSATVPLGEK